MAEFTLWFTGRKFSGELASTGRSKRLSVQLHRTQYRHDNEQYLCYRGTPTPKGSLVTAFRWSPAVKALCLLFLKHARERYLSSQAAGTLIGESPSAAASLDYALGKQPNWLLDMFGISYDGECGARKLIQRINPEQKRPGPVTVLVNSQLLPPSNVVVYVNDQLVRSPEVLNLLIENISGQLADGSEERKSAVVRYDAPYESMTLETPPLPAPFNDEAWRATLREAFTREISTMLRQTNIFSEKAVRRTIERVRKNPSFSKLTKGEIEFISTLDEQLLRADRIGQLRTEEMFALLIDSPAIRIAVTPAQVSTIAILTYLRDFEGKNIELVYDYSLGTDIVESISKKSIPAPLDGCVLTIASAGRLLGYNTPFQPLLLMPGISHQVVSHEKHINGNGLLESGTVLLVSDEPSTPSFVFDDLVRHKLIQKERLKTDWMHPFEVTESMLDENNNTHTILGFPHYEFLRLFAGCELLAPDSPMLIREAILFVSSQFAADHRRIRALDIAIRTAWLTLLEQPEVLDRVVEKVLDSPLYIRHVGRTCGLFQIPWAEVKHGN